MLLENGLTRSLLARASQRSSLAVCKFCTVKSEERFAQGYDRCLREMGTPQNGDPGPHIPSDMGTGGPHITRDVGLWGPQNSGDMGTIQ